MSLDYGLLENEMYLSEIFCKTSRTGRIMVPVQQLTLASRSFSIRGSSHCNMLPGDIRNESSIGIFKQKVRKWVTERVARFLE